MKSNQFVPPVDIQENLDIEVTNPLALPSNMINKVTGQRLITIMTNIQKWNTIAKELNIHKYFDQKTVFRLDTNLIKRKRPQFVTPTNLTNNEFIAAYQMSFDKHRNLMGKNSTVQQCMLEMKTDQKTKENKERPTNNKNSRRYNHQST